MFLINKYFFHNNNVKLLKRKTLSYSYLSEVVFSGIRTFADDFSYRISTSAVKEKLQSQNATFSEGYTCYKIKGCVFCKSEHSSTNDSYLFINKKTGNFLCHQCKMFGQWSTLNRIQQYNKGKSGSEYNHKTDCSTYDVTNEWHSVINDTYDLWKVDDEKLKLLMHDFNIFHWSKTVIQRLGVKFDVEKNVMLFPMYCQNTVVGYMSLTRSGTCSTFPKIDCPGLLLYNEGKKISQVIVVADIKDFLVLTVLRLSQHIICLPYGVKTLPQNLLPQFERYDQIILWLGENFGAWNASTQFSRKLVEKRCFLIRPTETQTSVSRAVSNGGDVKKIVSDAKPIWHQCVTTFNSLREDVLAEIQNVTEIAGVHWSRFPLLNNILKGHRRGELTVLTGPTGSGKTTFLSEYSLDLAMNGVNTLWGSFEIKNSRLVRTMLQQFAQTPLTPNNIDLFHAWADKFENLPIYFLTFHGQQALETVMDAVEHCSYTYDIAHVIVDNVQFMIDVGSEVKYLSRFWTQDCILQSFRKFATANNCHVTLVIHPRKEIEGTDLSTSSIFGTAKAAQEADNVLIIQENNQSIPGMGKKYLQVCKNRFTGDLGRMPLHFDRSSLSFARTPGQSQTVSKKDAATEESFTKDKVATYF